VSSIRLFILGSLAERGPMHGHAIRLLAEEEHIDQWADVTVGAIYGAIKRLAAEQLIESVRVEREGNYPERQVYAITDAGKQQLVEIRRHALTTVVHRPDPVDLALARLGDEDAVAVIEARLVELRAHLAFEHENAANIAKYLSLMEQHVMLHDSYRLRGEIAWHEELLGALPEIIADEKARRTQ
jgi:DNA-binding PadR family transcriptional regulator